MSGFAIVRRPHSSSYQRCQLRDQKWELNREALARLLEALDADQDTAGEKYIALRTSLTDLFAWQRCDSPDNLADETLNRVGSPSHRDSGRHTSPESAPPAL